MLHVAWDSGRIAVLGWHDKALPHDRVRSLAARLFGDAVQPIERTVAIPGRRDQVLLHGVGMSVSSLLDAIVINTWVPWTTLSPSLGWVAEVAALSQRLVLDRQIVPSLDPDTGATSWVPMVDERSTDDLVTLTESQPPIVGALELDAAPWQFTSVLVESFVDLLARSELVERSAHLEARDPRPIVALTKHLAQSLTNATLVPADSTEQGELRSRMSSALARWSAPLTSRSPFADYFVFLRLGPTDEEIDLPTDEWLASLYVAPRVDQSRYIPAHQVWESSEWEGARAALLLATVRLRRVAPTLGIGFDSTHPTTARVAADDVLHAVRQQLDDIIAAGIAVQLPSWWSRPRRARVIGRATPTERTLVASGLNTKAVVTIDWKVAVGDDELTEQELRALADAKRDLVAINGRWTMIDREQVARALTTVIRRQQELATASPLELLSLTDTNGDSAYDSTDSGERSDDVDVEVIGDDWAGQLLRGLPDDQVTPIERPEGFIGTLRPYQQRGVGWLAFLSRIGLGALLADDMGLGKTAQLLALIAHEGTGPTLVVCPMSVVRNWETEAARFVPTLRVAVHHGVARQSGESFESWMSNHDLVVTTYATAAKDVDVLNTVTWARVVIDEAQQIKNSHTTAAKALRRIPSHQRIALTGTPVENRLADLWSVMDLVNPGVLGTKDQFRRTVAAPIERHKDERATARLRNTISPLMLRRSKTDRSLVPELPEKVELTAWANLTKEQAGLYRAVTERLLERIENMEPMQRRGAIVATLTKLKQICNHPVHFLGDAGTLDGRSGKLARFDELIDQAFESDDQIIAFTQYVEMGHLVQRHLLERRDLSVPFLSGSVAKRRRDMMVEEFQGGRHPLLLVSLKAGGSGLNLTAAGQVVHIDRWWNPAVEDQASDRAWRIGQQQTVFVHKLTTRGTIEERIDTLINEKRALADRVLGDGEGWITELSTDELRRLITLDES
jgi:superfamily II DNA or RNA helicase